MSFWEWAGLKEPEGTGTSGGLLHSRTPNSYRQAQRKALSLAQYTQSKISSDLTSSGCWQSTLSKRAWSRNTKFYLGSFQPQTAPSPSTSNKTTEKKKNQNNKKKAIAWPNYLCQRKNFLPCNLNLSHCNPNPLFLALSLPDRRVRSSDCVSREAERPVVLPSGHLRIFTQAKSSFPSLQLGPAA